MADITYGYIPADGVAFSISGWNTDVRSTTGGVSLLGEMNGRLSDANLAAGVTLPAGRYKPGEVHVGAVGSERTTRDFYDSLFGADPTPGADAWLVVPGPAARFYLPWAADAVLCQAAAFLTNWRQRETTDPSPAGIVTGGPEMYVRMAVDGSPLAHTRRPLPYTAYPANNPGNADSMVSRVSVLTQHLDLVHLMTGVAAGWHSVRLEILIPRTMGRETLVPLYFSHPEVAEHYVRHHVRLGVRHATLIAM